MINKFKIEFRKQQLYLEFDVNQPVIVQCNTDGTATYIPGLLDPNPWVDMTAYTENLDKLKLTWEAFTDDYAVSLGTDQASANQFGSNYSKAISADLGFTGVAFQFIYDWLMTNNCQILNAVEVRITDMNCGKTFRIFEIKTDNIRYAPFDAPCYITVPLREQDIVFDSLAKTIIEDDWQGWFNSDGTSTKQHPTFQYIVEKRPHFILAILVFVAYLAGSLSIGIVNAFDFFREWVRQLLGVCFFSPAPLIRTYIENACDKYGYTMNTMFDDIPANEYRDLCMFYPVENFEKNFEDYSAGSLIYNYDNRTGLAVSVWLDQLKKVFNAEWYITPNRELVFQPKSYFDGLAPIIDFTSGAFQIYNFFYDFNGTKKAAYGDYQYRIDPQDSCSNDLKWRYGDIVDYDGIAANPMLEGSVNKQFDFASTGFIYDGDTEDFLERNIEAGRTIAQVAILIGLIGLFAIAGFVTAAVSALAITFAYNFTDNYIHDFFGEEDELKNSVRTASNVINVPRLLLWDRATPMNSAKVLTSVSPTQNPYYNTNGDTYYQAHPSFDAPGGYFGSTVTEIANYKMFVDAKFEDNLFEFHEYDNPLKNPQTNQTFEGDVDLCCETAELFGFYNGDFARIGAVVILENRNGRLIKARLTYIEPDYDRGQIHLKGTVLK